MQVKTESCKAKHYIDDDFYINPEDIAGYIIQRSPTSNILFNIYAVSQNNEWLFCAASDLSFEKATSYVDALNQEHYPYVPSPTEAVFIEVGGVDKVYNITTRG